MQKVKCMNEFIVYDADNKETGFETNKIVLACKEAFAIKGTVGVRNLRTNDIKEILKGETISYFANYKCNNS